jgi:hypothetical protein
MEFCGVDGIADLGRIFGGSIEKLNERDFGDGTRWTIFK